MVKRVSGGRHWPCGATGVRGVKLDGICLWAASCRGIYVFICSKVATGIKNRTLYTRSSIRLGPIFALYLPIHFVLFFLSFITNASPSRMKKLNFTLPRLAPRALMTALLLTAGLTLLTACGKDDETPTPPAPAPSKTALLAADGAKNWRYFRFTIDNVAQPLAACQTDDRYTYRINGTMVVDNAGTACDALDETRTGTWRFINNETQVVQQLNLSNGFSRIDTFKVYKLTTDTLVLRNDKLQIKDYTYVRQ